MTYEIKELEIGILEQQTVLSALMPRADFIELVEETIDKLVWTVSYLQGGDREEERTFLRKELLPVAETMPRFPIHSWCDETRGCGCVVGEYLVASQAVERAALAASGDAMVLVDAVLTEQHGDIHGNLLRRFGSDIDYAVCQKLSARGARIADGRGAVHSVEFID